MYAPLTFWGNHVYNGFDFKHQLFISHLILRLCLRTFDLFWLNNFFQFYLFIILEISECIRGFTHYALNQTNEISI